MLGTVGYEAEAAANVGKPLCGNERVGRADWFISSVLSSWDDKAIVETRKRKSENGYDPLLIWDLNISSVGVAIGVLVISPCS